MAPQILFFGGILGKVDQLIAGAAVNGVAEICGHLEDPAIVKKLPVGAVRLYYGQVFKAPRVFNTCTRWATNSGSV